MAITSWKEKVKVKQAQCAAAIPPEWTLPASSLHLSVPNVLDIPRACGILTERELHITSDYDATGLLEMIAAGQFSSFEVTTAFCKRAAVAQQLTSCLTEMFFDVALTRAKQLDDHLTTTGSPMGPLHGLPISLKDSFNIPGIPTTLGFVSFLDNPPASTSSALVEILLNAGAVLYVKTNVPQTLMTADSQNNVFDRVLNPHNRSLTAGGSSGGEEALIAMRGSILGVGTDIAGSIRIPALCCGMFGFKPTACRVPYAGQVSAGRPGLASIIPSAGPLCHSIRDAELFLRVVLDPSINPNAKPADLDDNALAVPWLPPPSKLKQKEEENEILAIGLLPEDPRYPLHPPMRRTLHHAVRALAAAGHRIVDLELDLASENETVQPSLFTRAKEIALQYFRQDPDKTPLRRITDSGEPVIPSLRYLYDLGSSEHEQEHHPKKQEPTLRDLFELNVARSQLAAQMRTLFVRRKLDLILGAAYQTTAVPHDTYEHFGYTVIWNLINVSSPRFFFANGTY
jgi:Asp-tRNA(Asn)/Glu-tRNA(Gln) amidotransferase A subunit family amidase